MVLELKKIFISSLQEEQILCYKALTIPAAYFLLNPSKNEEGYTLAIEARLDNQVVGLALAEIYFINQTAQLYSLFVKTSYREQGIGKALFCFLQDCLVKEEKVRAIGFEYEKNTLHTKAIEKILAAQQWDPAKLYLIRCYFDAQQFNPPWIHLIYRFPPSLILFKWEQLNVQDEERICLMAEQGKFLSYLSPFRQKELIHYPTSIGLRYEGQLIGWSLTHLIDPHTIRYTALFIDKAFHLSGYGIRLLNESIHLHKQLSIPWALFEINLQEIDPSWRFFVKKRLIPYADKVERMKWALHVFI